MSDKLETKGVDWSSLPQEIFPGVGDRVEYSPSYFSGSVLTQHVMRQEKGHVSEMSAEGSIKKDSKDPKGLRYHTMMEKLGGHYFTDGLPKAIIPLYICLIMAPLMWSSAVTCQGVCIVQ